MICSPVRIGVVERRSRHGTHRQVHIRHVVAGDHVLEPHQVAGLLERPLASRSASTRGRSPGRQSSAGVDSRRPASSRAARRYRPPDKLRGPRLVIVPLCGYGCGSIALHGLAVEVVREVTCTIEAVDRRSVASNEGELALERTCRTRPCARCTPAGQVTALIGDLSPVQLAIGAARGRGPCRRAGGRPGR